MNPTPQDTRIRPFLAVLIVTSFIGLIILWTFYAPSEDNKTTLAMVNTLIGLLGAASGAVVQYYFGSSSSSTQKDSTLASIATGGTGPGNGGAAITVNKAADVTVTSADPEPPKAATP